MGVKASAAGVRAIAQVINDRKLYAQQYAKMTVDLELSSRTIADFAKGKSVRKTTAEKIINSLNLNRSDIIPDAEWYKGTADEAVSIEEQWEELCQRAQFAPLRLKMDLAVEDMANMTDEGEPQYLTEIVAKSKVWIHLDVQQPGYLILLDVDSTGKIICLSPVASGW